MPETESPATLDDARALYADQGLLTRGHLAARRYLSPLADVEELVPLSGDILDLGCGHGLFSHYMALRAPARRIHGGDPDPAKMASAVRTRAPLGNVTFTLGDIDAVPSNVTFLAVTIVDVMYLLPDETKRYILQRCHELLAPGGVVVYKTQVTSPRWQFLVTSSQEWVMTSLGLTRGAGLHYLSEEAVCDLLHETGFSVRARRLPSRIVYPNMVFVGRRSS